MLRVGDCNSEPVLTSFLRSMVVVISQLVIPAVESSLRCYKLLSFKCRF